MVNMHVCLVHIKKKLEKSNIVTGLVLYFIMYLSGTQQEPSIEVLPALIFWIGLVRLNYFESFEKWKIDPLDKDPLGKSIRWVLNCKFFS